MNRLAKICLSVGIVFILNSSFAFGMMKDDDERPNEHLCPITLEVMEDPVVAADGHSYERTAILEYFRRWGAAASSPLTGLPLPNQSLFDNLALRTLIKGWNPGRQSGPAAHLCPITKRVMEDPVVAADGHSYERTAILVHFLRSGASASSPLTGLPLPNQSLFDNLALKTLIDDWEPGWQSGSSELATRDTASNRPAAKGIFDFLNYLIGISDFRSRPNVERVQEELRENAESTIAIPEIARGHEAIYERFLKGVLVYRPTEGSDVGKIELPIAALPNPLGSSFDLSSCGDTGQYLSIATGYRKVKTPANANKVEIWFTPRFLVDKEMPHLAPNHHMRQVIRSWDSARAPIGIFCTWGGWNATDHMTYCDYVVSEAMEQLGTENLLRHHWRAIRHSTPTRALRSHCKNFTFRL
ncbi:MAG: hypothetical protein A3G78_07820 [Alphaproteobacteria bacterium RIFCSPLOWO2_12_FULL_42_29]|nr:MAG: hypothetical protein A3E50_00525 [Alphaproteobacteria bacterium RIFCSPHIGHO2_12_FULL_42_100]OFW84765.1 MAG: hypothetical protein A2W06_01570 [Alphaproteobacteria bacterium RBG_16_42_14]OFX05964.1 MAG: hypothetical protein A3H46_06605 [Alphaproteobacteria bacterium RIFCSPLOWO2_02_FULL_43_54]OFX08452.1 MAG: hypothetical protein A3G78_07820 [Alphaproteobacteria bacterium RIFCSPLOWO2_12_FULL_42_29]